jgi:hypothetical protein
VKGSEESVCALLFTPPMARVACAVAVGVLLSVAGCGDEKSSTPAESERSALTVEVVAGDESYRFNAPDGLAKCAATPAHALVRCDIDVTGDPARGACVIETAFSFTVGRSDANFLCVTESVLADDARPLAAGDRLAVGAVTCTVAADPRIRCENAARHGFELRPGNQKVF